MPTKIVLVGGDSIEVSEPFEQVERELKENWDTGWIPFDPIANRANGEPEYRHRVRPEQIVRVEYVNEREATGDPSARRG
jgi:hypothetical protein